MRQLPISHFAVPYKNRGRYLDNISNLSVNRAQIWKLWWAQAYTTYFCKQRNWFHQCVTFLMITKPLIVQPGRPTTCSVTEERRYFHQPKSQNLLGCLNTKGPQMWHRWKNWQFIHCSKNQVERTFREPECKLEDNIKIGDEDVDCMSLFTNNWVFIKYRCLASYELLRKYFESGIHFVYLGIRGCIQKFPDRVMTK